MLYIFFMWLIAYIYYVLIDQQILDFQQEVNVIWLCLSEPICFLILCSILYFIFYIRFIYAAHKKLA